MLEHFLLVLVVGALLVDHNKALTDFRYENIKNVCKRLHNVGTVQLNQLKAYGQFSKEDDEAYKCFFFCVGSNAGFKEVENTSTFTFPSYKPKLLLGTYATMSVNYEGKVLVSTLKSINRQYPNERELMAMSNDDVINACLPANLCIKVVEKYSQQTHFKSAGCNDRCQRFYEYVKCAMRLVPRDEWFKRKNYLELAKDHYLFG